jgi:hypothetical protein
MVEALVRDHLEIVQKISAVRTTSSLVSWSCAFPSSSLLKVILFDWDKVLRNFVLTFQGPPDLTVLVEHSSLVKKQ